MNASDIMPAAAGITLIHSYRRSTGSVASRHSPHADVEAVHTRPVQVRDIVILVVHARESGERQLELRAVEEKRDTVALGCEACGGRAGWLKPAAIIGSRWFGSCACRRVRSVRRRRAMYWHQKSTEANATRGSGLRRVVEGGGGGGWIARDRAAGQWLRRGRWGTGKR
jgi:hypothetical protein